MFFFYSNWCDENIINPTSILPPRFAVRDRGNKLTSPSQQFYNMLLQLEKNYRLLRCPSRVPEAKIVESIDRDSFFSCPNDTVLDLAMFRYVRMRAHISTVQAAQQHLLQKKRKKTAATRKILKSTGTTTS